MAIQVDEAALNRGRKASMALALRPPLQWTTVSRFASDLVHPADDLPERDQLRAFEPRHVVLFCSRTSMTAVVAAVKPLLQIGRGLSVHKLARVLRPQGFSAPFRIVRILHGDHLASRCLTIPAGRAAAHFGTIHRLDTRPPLARRPTSARRGAPRCRNAPSSAPPHSPASAT